MPRKPKGSIRRSQLITTYGIGSIIAVEDESFMVAGIDRWEPRPPDLHEPRLERQLHVNGFRIPPASENGSDIPVVRFPRGRIVQFASDSISIAGSPVSPTTNATPVVSRSSQAVS